MRLAAALFIVCLLALPAGGAAAQTLYEVEGVVYGPDRRPIGRVVVFLENQSRARLNQAITDSDGRYRFSRVPAGIYYLVFNADVKLYQPAVQRLELLNTGGGGTNLSSERLDVVLSPVPRAASGAAGVVFAQEVPPAAEREYMGAMESLSKDRKPRAVGQLKRALEIFPDYFLAAQQLGLFHVEQGDYAEAIPPLQKALTVNPKAFQSYVALGIAYVNTGQPDPALATLERALALDSRSFHSQFYRGIALLNLERLDEAEGALKKAYEIGGREKAAATHLYLASIYSKRGQYQKAVDELEAYLRENPQAKNAANIKQVIAQLKSKL